MKKVVCLLAVVALLTVLAVSAFANEETTLVIDTVDAVAGETVEINLSIVNNPGITLLEGVLSFDTTALEFVSLEIVGMAEWNWMAEVMADPQNAKFGTFTCAANEPLTGDCAILKLTVRVKDDVLPGSYEVKFVTEVFGDDYEDFVEIGTEFTGAVNVACTNHVWDEGVVTKEPTCVEEGVKLFTCTLCGETKEEAIPTVDHTWGEWTLTTEPACGVEGEETRTCSVCGETEARAVAALEHAWGEWTLTTEPACGVEGEETRTCANCGETETRAVAALEHAWGEWTLTTEPACGVEGEETRTCANCGETETRAVAALEHVWGDFVVTTEPTCCDDGEETRICELCGETETQPIVATGDHELAYIDNADGLTHKIVCATTGKELNPAEDHTYGEFIDDVENPGWKYKVCDRCGYVHREGATPPPTGDNSVIAVAVAALSMMGIAVVVSKKKEF